MNKQAKQHERIGTTSVPVLPAPMRWIDTTPVKFTERACSINSLDMCVHVCGLHADVVETLVIRNPNKRDLSVELAIPLPDRAVVHGYALEIDGQMIDGVVVPKEKARVTFETEQRFMADPGLVEAVKGNVYRTRVYPVPAHSTRTVQLRYTAPLAVVDGTAAFFDAPMPAEKLKQRTVRIDVELLDCPAPKVSGVSDAQFRELGTCWRAESHERNVVAKGGMRVALPELPASFALVERDAQGDVWFAVSERAVPATQCASPEITSLTVLWDASGSRAYVDHEAELELLCGYCAADSIETFRLVTFSNQVQEMLAFETADELVRCIGELRYDGGSDFQALRRAVAGMPLAGPGDVCVLFSDGLDTLSDEPLAFPENCKVLAVVSGVQRDAESLRQACGGLAFDLASAPKGPDGLAHALWHSNLLTALRGEGVAETTGIGSGADGRYAVVGKLVAESATVAFENTGTEFAIEAAAAREGSVLAHAWASARVAQLSVRADENADELLLIGRRFGVVSPATSLIVLETLDQWLRYDIEPPATWEQMHGEWERCREGVMRVSSEEGAAQDHLQELRREWAGLLAWWERDFSGQSTAGGDTAFCPMCGKPVQPDWQFCFNCGAQLPVLGRSESGTVFGGAASDLGESFAECWAMGAMDEGALPGERSAYAAASFASASMAAAPAAAPTAAPEAAFDAMQNDSGAGAGGSVVEVKPWMPDASYLAALDEAFAGGIEAARGSYFQQRAEYAASPSYFIDCAGWFLAHGDAAFGVRVLTNLAELRIEDAALLRVMAWRLREAGELESALSTLRRVLKLRPEDSQSHRDLALVLSELAYEALSCGKEAAARRYAEESGSFYRTVALTPWARRAMAVSLFAVEEYNVLRAWAAAHEWKEGPQLESLDDGLEGVLDCDLRITLAWDADETDVDLHVTEPTGEEAYYGNRLTHAGGRVSEDITDGYGPELYEVRHAREGVYNIRAHYYASHQQTVFGPASCTLTIYTDWGRSEQKQQITSTRLESAHEMVTVGTATYAS